MMFSAAEFEKAESLCNSLNELKEHDSINWKNVISLIQRKSKFLFYSRHVEKVCNTLPDLLLKHNCKSLRLVMIIMHTYHRWWDLDIEFRFSDFIKKKKISHILEPLLTNGYHVGNFPELKMTNAVFKYGIKRICQVMLKYGRLTEPTDVNELDYHYKDILYMIARSFSDIPDIREVWKYFPMIIHGTKQIKQVFFNYDGSENRYFLIASAISAVLNEKQQEAEGNYVECFILYLRSIPDPFPSEEEVSSTMLNIFNESAFKERVAQKMVEDFKDCFGSETSERLSPRSLEHLCRCTIRKVLVKDRIFRPKLVKKLFLPEILKQYLFGMQ